MEFKYLRYILSLFAIVLLLAILRVTLYSEIKIVDPSGEQQSVTLPFDVVVDHLGCGTVDVNSFQAYLDKDESTIPEISSKFRHVGDNRWIVDELDSDALSEGSHSLTVSVNLSPNDLCFHNDQDRLEFEVSPSLRAGRFETLIHDRHDIDKFKIQAPPTSDFGRWFLIRVRTTSDYPDHKLYFRLLGPANDENLVTTKKPDSAIWVALKSGVYTEIRIKTDSVFPDGVTSIPYEVTVESQGIPNRQEPNDEKTEAATMPYLPKDQAAEFYLASVLDVVEDEDGKKKNVKVGIPDWFKIDHHNCIVDCMEISSTTIQYALSHCQDVEDSSCSGLEKIKTTRLCSSDGAANEEGDGDRYLGVYCSPDDCPPYGKIDSSDGQAKIPSRYLKPYSIKWSEGEQYGIHPDTHRCERD